ncbi:Serine protease, subtilisin family [Ornithinimicrobium cerasi]|uniref:Serine protease, subtilisin family n=2 Tax=Ornithinimicrobium cerasi TaxID=2248773 RepID=A0A285VUM9_9MICO|nr:Serine protease, subtilisin family [Ornithinimicrobium cerasi]
MHRTGAVPTHLGRHAMTHTRRRTLAALTGLTLALGLAAPGVAAQGPPDAKAPLLEVASAQVVEGRYLVMLDTPATGKAGPGERGSERAREAVRAATERKVAQARGRGIGVSHAYTALGGYAATLTPAQLAELRADPDVAWVEPDTVVSLDATQTGATWGLDRIDQRDRPLSGTYTYDATGQGVRSYVIDTGILTSHTELSGRTAAGYTAINDGRGTTDCNGHGTHVAGTVGGTRYGVAKQTTLVPVRVLGCNGSGTNSGVVAGMDWVARNAVRPAVANMSLGGGASTTTDAAVDRMVAAGVTVVVAAGNENQNACNVSPARAASAITVGSTTSSDARSSFSNFGSCVDLFAPGSSITSAWYTSTSATNTISGTSMASPHVAGAAALYLQGNPSASPAQVTSAIVNGATTGRLTSLGSGSPNRLLYTPALTGGGTVPEPEPVPTGIVNGGFESGATGWAGDTGIIGAGSYPARTGVNKAWFGGWGRTTTESLTQQLTVPSTGATLDLWLRVVTAETTRSTAYDRFSVQVLSNGTTTTLGTWSNLNASSGYVQRSVSLDAFAGRTVTLRLVGTEDSTLATSFLVDDLSLR